MFYRIIALLFLMPVQAQANAQANAPAIECETESPLKVALGEEYYDLINNPDGMPHADKKLVNQAIDMLDNARFRKGQVTSIICKKVDGVLTAVSQTFQLKDANSHYTAHGDINLSAWTDDRKSRHVGRHLITFPLSITWQPGNATNELLVNHRFRSAGSGHGSTTVTHSLVELDIALTVLDKGIGVIQTKYTNGYLSEQSNWTLYKR